MPLFYMWLGVSVVVLARRRMSSGTFRPQTEDVTEGPAHVVEATSFPPPPPVDAPPAAATSQPADDATVAVKAPPPPIASGEPSETLAEAISGIALPCDLMPLITDRFEPRVAAFSTHGYDAAVVGTAVADEFERLGFELDPTGATTIEATRGPDQVQIRLASAALDSDSVMETRFPQARPDALVVEIRLI